MGGLFCGIRLGVGDCSFLILVLILLVLFARINLLGTIVGLRLGLGFKVGECCFAQLVRGEADVFVFVIAFIIAFIVVFFQFGEEAGGCGKRRDVAWDPEPRDVDRPEERVAVEGRRLLRGEDFIHHLVVRIIRRSNTHCPKSRRVSSECTHTHTHKFTTSRLGFMVATGGLHTMWISGG